MLAILMGGAVSESLSLLLNIILYFFDRRRFGNQGRQRSFGKVGVAEVALPVAISAYMRSGLIAVEHMLIPRGLMRYGAGNSAALAAYGSLHSMALPVVLYPAAILSSFAALLIPEVTEQQAKSNRIEIRYIAGRVYQMTLLFAFGAAGIMLCLSAELGEVLYQSSEVAYFIAALAPLIPIMYLDTATDAMLKGLGQQVYSMNVNIFDAMVSVVAVAIFVPKMGINGYLLTIYITELLNASLSIARLLKISGFSPSLKRVVLSPLISAIGSTCLLRLFFTLFPLGLGNTVAGLVLHIFFALLLYLLLLFMTGGLARTDAKWLVCSLIPRSNPSRKSQKSRCLHNKCLGKEENVRKYMNKL